MKVLNEINVNGFIGFLLLALHGMDMVVERDRSYLHIDIDAYIHTVIGSQGP